MYLLYINACTFDIYFCCMYQTVITAKDKKIPDNLYWPLVESANIDEYKANLNNIFHLYPTAAEYLHKIPVNHWIQYAICDELLSRNPKGGGGTYGWRTNNMAEGSQSRNKPWRTLHVLHFFHRFVKAFAGWIDYINEKKLEWHKRTLTPCAQRRLTDATAKAISREGMYTIPEFIH